MKFQNNKGNGKLTRTLLSQNEASRAENGLHLTESLAKRDPSEPQTSQVISKSLGHFLQTQGNALLLKITPSQLIEHRWTSVHGT